ncbi:hypothetical protein DNL40_14510 [Xylanimonas oleitrophica]|uniref:Cardiolipin synthase N-terminal domain-containing protein n=1 Tax=Xylanimonas oleitrophica TaxID=2607479 RepID=A0A2W5WVI1_9MICO|nr:PLD nuclease N-terminal domain-containing protein [Xylanimonas oleitrophica]PZR51825.1 hypothetical protein DNL40_14510 [Xylanimonas oleitrophica]
MLRVLIPLVVIGLVVYALADLARVTEDETGGLPKWAWAVIIVLLPGAGSLAWIVFRRAQRGSGGGYDRRSGGPGRRPSPGRPVAPDDDPEFLWRLEQERRRRQRGEAGGSGGAGGSTGGSGETGGTGGKDASGEKGDQDRPA